MIEKLSSCILTISLSDPPISSLVIGGMMVHSVLKSQQIGQHITSADGKMTQPNGGRCLYIMLVV